MTKRKRRAGKGIQHRKLAFRPEDDEVFSRADLVFEGVRHDAGSYEVRAFLNNQDADETTARSVETGYAGHFVVFGHGGCYGAADHCDTNLATAIAGRPDAITGRRHPLAPHTRMLTITEPLRRLLDRPGHGLETLTLVPISKAPRQADRGIVADALEGMSVSLRTYR